MVYEPVDLARARVLISNDDGIQASGLALLERIVRGLAQEVWVVAPETEQSAASHSLTMRRPLFIRQLDRHRFTVDGTPTDCVLLAVHEILKEQPLDLVLSGINRGGNLGEDAIYSGTVAAAREGALLGFRSVALSQQTEPGWRFDWATAERWTAEVLTTLAATGWPPSVVLNVNFPPVSPDQVGGIAITRSGRRKIGGDIIKGVDPRGEPFFWIGGGRDEDRELDGSDLKAVHGGLISVTPLALDLTDEAALAALQACASLQARTG